MILQKGFAHLFQRRGRQAFFQNLFRHGLSLVSQGLADSLGVPVIFPPGTGLFHRQPGSQPVIGPAGPDAWRHHQIGRFEKGAEIPAAQGSRQGQPLLIQGRFRAEDVGQGLNSPGLFLPLLCFQNKAVGQLIAPAKGSGDPPSPLGFFLQRGRHQIIIGFVDGDDRPGHRHLVLPPAVVAQHPAGQLRQLHRNGRHRMTGQRHRQAQGAHRCEHQVARQQQRSRTC